MTRKHYHGHKLYILPLPRKSKRKKRSVQPNVKIRTDPLLLARLFLPFFLPSLSPSLPFPPIFSKSSPLPSPNTSNSSCNSNVFHQEERSKERREGGGRGRERERGSCTAMHRHPISFTNRFQTVFIRRRRAVADRERARAREGGDLDDRRALENP